ncbi:helix-turn-helix domain-containing protein [Cohnella sp.]|uniref:helix-turn-helix domain-containing protein n=1 Tax=Cohnella sp. TaxID=1883426 RepID=UPI003561A90B
MENHNNALTVLNSMLFKLVDIEFIRLDSGWKMKRDFPASYKLLLIAGGKGQVDMDGVRYRVSRSQCFLAVCTPTAVVYAEPDTDQQLQCYQIDFDVIATLRQPRAHHRSHEDRLPFPYQMDLYTGSHLALLQLAETLYMNRYHEEELDIFKNDITFRELLYRILSSGNSVQRKADTRKAIDRTIEFMAQTYPKDTITLARLADIAGLSPAYYSYLFKREVGKSPIEYLTDLRIKRAKELVFHPNEQLKRVAMSIGFKDEHYFSRRFKQRVGLSPMAFIKRGLDKIVSLSCPYTNHLRALSTVPYVSDLDEVELEASYTKELLAAKPDAIICHDLLDEKAREQLKKIAPTIVIPWMSMDWQEQFRMISRILGKEKDSEDWMIKHEEKVERARGKIKENIVAEETVAIYRVYQRELSVFGARNIGHVFYRSLKLNPPLSVKKEMETGKMGTIFNSSLISLETLAEHAADRILIMVYDDAVSKEHFDGIRKTPLWRDLRAVRNNQVHFIRNELWGMYDPLSIDAQLDEAVKLLTQSS